MPVIGAVRSGWRASAARRGGAIAGPFDSRRTFTAPPLTERLERDFVEDIELGRGTLWMPVAFAAGIMAYFAFPREPSWAALASLGVILGAAALRCRHRPGTFAALVMVAMLVLGTAAAALETRIVATPVLTAERTYEVTGRVLGRETFGPGRVRYVVDVERLSGLPPERTPRRVRISTHAKAPPLAVGDGLAGLARLGPPRGPVYPGGYDSARRLFFAGIGASGFSYGAPHRTEIGDPPPLLAMRAAVARVRAAAAGRIRESLPGRNGELAAALLVGERGGIPDDTEEALRASGLGHILAISGLHMALVAGSVYAAIRALLALLPALALRRPIKKWAAIGGLVAATFYLVLSGASVATVRAYVMLAVGLLAVLADRPALTLRTVAVAAFVVMLLDPAVVIAPGFQMSFAAAIALVAAYEWLSTRERRHAVPGRSVWLRAARIAGLAVCGLALTSLIAGLATSPLSAYHFHRLAPLGLLANLAAMPVVSAVVMPAGVLALLGLPFGFDPLPLSLMGLGLDWVVGVAVWAQQASGTSGLTGRISQTGVLLAVFGMLWLSIWTRPWRLLGIAGIAAGVALMPFTTRFDVLVADDGRTVAARGPDGRLRVLRDGGGDFAIEVWLRADADPRSPDDESLTEGVVCDPLGCALPLGTTNRGGTALATVAQRYSALADDCALSRIVMTRQAAPACAGPVLVIDRSMLRDTGALAITLDDADPPGIRRIERARPPIPRPWHVRPYITR